MYTTIYIDTNQLGMIYGSWSSIPCHGIFINCIYCIYVPTTGPSPRMCV